MNKKSIRSCTSMVATGKATQNGNLLFAKNSDRSVNESQPLCYYPEKDHKHGDKVRCTYIEIPQVEHTYACYGSRPYNIFGFEHGINEHGLVIGNEAVSGKEIPERQWGLIGMDILRLTLERCKTASDAVEMMGWFLETYGTGGDPSQRITSFNTNCIIADENEAYLFESCQRCWVAKKVEDTGYLSNCYSIGKKYDLIGKDTVKTAIKNGWAYDENDFHPANAFTVDDCVFAEAEGFLRYTRLPELMDNRSDLDLKAMMNNLRDHYEGKGFDNLPYSIAAAKIPSICSHPGGMSGCASAASVVAEIKKDVPKELKFTYWGSMAPPCCSIFRPYYNINWLPEDVQYAEALYSDQSQWWVFTELERYISLNYDMFAPRVRKEFDVLENQFIQKSLELEKNYSGDQEVLKTFVTDSSRESLELAKKHIGIIKDKVAPENIDRILLTYFKESSAGCNMPYDPSKIK